MVLLASSPEDLQLLFKIRSSWFANNHMVINAEKSKVMHFIPISIDITDFCFECSDLSISTVEKYTYLGLVLINI